MAAKLYNVKIPVKNLAESIAFYNEIFNPLGYADGEQFNDPYDKKPTVVFGSAKQGYFEIVEAPELIVSHDINSHAGPRIEFVVDQKEDVDRFYEFLCSKNVPILLKPQRLYQGVLPDDEIWYAFYFMCPNNHKFGVVYVAKNRDVLS